jgi:hypothetical protein
MIIAIDPGTAGGIVIQQGQEILACCRMPETDGDIKRVIDDAIFKATIGGICAMDHKRAVIEKVSGFAGGEGHPGSAMFNFGDSYGFIRGVLTEKGFRIELLTPQSWQKILGLGHREHA